MYFHYFSSIFIFFHSYSQIYFLYFFHLFIPTMIFLFIYGHCKVRNQIFITLWELTGSPRKKDIDVCCLFIHVVVACVKICVFVGFCFFFSLSLPLICLCRVLLFKQSWCRKSENRWRNQQKIIDKPKDCFQWKLKLQAKDMFTGGENCLQSAEKENPAYVSIVILQTFINIYFAHFVD